MRTCPLLCIFWVSLPLHLLMRSVWAAKFTFTCDFSLRRRLQSNCESKQQSNCSSLHSVKNPCITLASLMTSDPCLPWSLTLRSLSLGQNSQLQGMRQSRLSQLQDRRLFNRLEMAACLKPPLPSCRPSPAADWCSRFCLGCRGWGLLSGTCPGKHPPPDNHTDRQKKLAQHNVNGL